jgi:hypothetical protein
MTNYTDPKYQKSNAKFKGHPDFQAKRVKAYDPNS